MGLQINLESTDSVLLPCTLGGLDCQNKGVKSRQCDVLKNPNNFFNPEIALWVAQ